MRVYVCICMFLCACVYYMYACVCIYTFLYMCIYINMCVYVCIYVYVCVYICVCICMYGYMCVYIYVCVCVCVRLHVRMAYTKHIPLPCRDSQLPNNTSYRITVPSLIRLQYTHCNRLPLYITMRTYVYMLL